ncbi:MAG: metal ABC transporter substrate-binding protein [Bifidobacteriaceae bacterium]|jgi:zinc transport system substrate-binding protein|nr:metal ABC transporter substrate-binding protein [Bifidobacteriaceae bacterium]
MICTAVIAGLAGCGSPPTATGDAATQVLVSFYPLQYLAEQIGGADVSVESLTPPGAEPHDLELSPTQVAQIGQADLVIYLSGFQPSVDQAIAERNPTNVIDAAAFTSLQPLSDESDAPSEGDVLDPHFWLDPTRMEPVASAIAEQLGGIVPDNAGDFEANSGRVVDELTTLDAQFEEGLAQCELRTIVVTHAAFGYLARRYGLTQISVGGIDPDSEPSPARIREVVQALEGTGVTTVFFESLASPDIAEALADQADLTPAVLDPLEATAQGDYMTRMDANLIALRTALECS